MEEVKASPHLQGKYEVIGVVPGPVRTKNHGLVDLRQVSLDLADKLAAEGFPYLKKVEAKAAKPANS